MRTSLSRLGLFLALALLAAGPAWARGQAMVAAANPLAAQAGMDVLKRGGDAADAAVAIQAVLGLVEPQSSGLGGGAFMTFYDARTHRVTAYNGREKAPSAAGPDLFTGADGKPLNFMTAVLSGHSTGAPGAVAMLALAQREHGHLAWKALFGDAERLARAGFVVSPRLAGFIASPYPAVHTPDISAYFTKADGSRYVAGDVLKNPAYAAFVRRLADEGPSALYAGRTAQAIADRIHAGPLAGTLTAADIAAYRPEEADAICRPLRAYLVCAPPPPSSGLGVIQALLMLDHTDIAKRGPNDPVAWLELAEAQRLIYADRDRYVGDADFVSVPIDGLLDPAYVAARAALIRTDMAGPPPQAGTPPGAPPRAPDATHEPGGTSHFVVVDRAGNVVSMTTSVESVFGSGRMVDGFVLNNQLTDFSFAPLDPDGAPAANAPAANKRPRSSMSPMMVLDNKGAFVAALGSPGGVAILAYNLKALVGVLDWGLTMQQAVALPNLIAMGPMTAGEADRFAPGVVAGLAARGLVVKPGRGEASGLHGVLVRGGELTGGADPRREGVVLSLP